jgi:hypothetical protein
MTILAVPWLPFSLSLPNQAIWPSLGISSIVAPDGIPVSEVALPLHIPIMPIITAELVLRLPTFFTGHRTA